MKAFFSLTFLLFFAQVLPAQLPPLSPPAKVEQMVGRTTVSLTFTRPMARGRQIFGGLVPFGKLWQIGAGASVLTTDGPITFGGTPVPAGEYAILAIPGKKEWTIMLNSAGDISALVEHNPAKNVASVKVPVVEPGRFHEALSFALDLSPGNARLYITWTDIQVSVPITTTAIEVANNYIDSLVNAPLAENSTAYFRAINYLTFNKRDLRKALALADKFCQLETGYYIHTMQRDIYAILGERENALSAGEEAMVVAKREFAGEPERLASVLQTLEEKQQELRKD